MTSNSVNPWDHRLSLESQSLKQHGKVLSRRYFSPSLLYALKNWTPTKIFHEPSGTSLFQGDIYQKYYGKKITTLSSKRDIVRVMNLRKMLKNAEMSDMRLRKLRSQKDLVLLVEAIHLTKQEIKKLLKGFQGRIGTDDCRELNLSRAIPVLMNDSKELNLEVCNPENFHTKDGMFSKMKRLKKLCFYILNEETGEEAEMINQNLCTQVLKDTVKSKSLEVFTLEFGGGKINHETLYSLLKLLAASNITSWYLNVYLTVDDFHWIDEMKPFLADVDVLTLESYFAGEFEGERVNGHVCPFLPLAMFEKIGGQGFNKVLKISYDQENEDEDKDNSKTVDISKYLAYCTGLKRLFIRSVGGKLGAPGQINFPAPLRDVTINFNNIYCPGYRNCDQSVLRSLLVGLEKMESLRSLKLFHARSDFSVPTSMDEEGKSEQIIFLGDEIQRIAKANLLEKIQIFDSGVFVHPMREVIQSMKNLKKFKLVLTGASERQKYWDEDFPFALLSDVEKIRICINSDVEFSQTWGFNLIRSLSEMKKLRVLQILDHSEKGLRLEIVFGLLNALSRAEKLEKLHILTSIIKDSESEKLNELLSVEVREMISNTTDRIFQDIRNIIQKMRRRCERLEKVIIGAFTGYPFKTIQYNKYVVVKNDEY